MAISHTQFFYPPISHIPDFTLRQFSVSQILQEANVYVHNMVSKKALILLVD